MIKNCNGCHKKISSWIGYAAELEKYHILDAKELCISEQFYQASEAETFLYQCLMF